MLGTRSLAKRAVVVIVSLVALPRVVFPVTTKSVVVKALGVNVAAVSVPVISASPFTCKPVPVILPDDSKLPATVVGASSCSSPVPFGLRIRCQLVSSVVIVLPLKRTLLRAVPPNSL